MTPTEREKDNHQLKSVFFGGDMLVARRAYRLSGLGEFDDVLILNRSPHVSCFLKCLKTVEKLKFAFISIWKFMKNETAPHPRIFHQTGKKKKIIFSAFLKGIFVTDSGRGKRFGIW